MVEKISREKFMASMDGKRVSIERKPSKADPILKT